MFDGGLLDPELIETCGLILEELDSNYPGTTIADEIETAEELALFLQEGVEPILLDTFKNSEFGRGALMGIAVAMFAVGEDGAQTQRSITILN